MNSNDEKQEEKVPSIKSILKRWNKDLRNGSFNTHGGAKRSKVELFCGGFEYFH